jgi:uncharacterized membrane protein YsdA (DUF1294 family)
MTHGLVFAIALLALGASLACLVAYAVDKRAAIRGRRRLRERTLLLLGLAGGWPGALVAQRLLRHKTAKASFQWKFRATVVLHLAACAALAAWLR